MTIRKHIMRVCLLAMALMLTMAFMPSMNGMAYAASKPAKVKNLKVSVKQYNKITVKWSKVKKAKKYEVFVKIGKAKKFKKFKTVKKTSLTFKGKYSTKYSFKVRAIKGKKKGKFSVIKKVATKAKPKKAPAGNPKKDEGTSDKEPAEEGENKDQQAVQRVEEAFKALPEIDYDMSEENLAKVKEALDAFAALTEEQKALIPEDETKRIQEIKEKYNQVMEDRLDDSEEGIIRKAIRKVEPGSLEVVTIDECEFHVLAKENNKALLLSKDFYGDNVKCSTNAECCEWANSDIRTLLNDGYLQEHPTIAALACETELSNPILNIVKQVGSVEDPTVTVENGEVTKDKVFILTRDDYAAGDADNLTEAKTFTYDHDSFNLEIMKEVHTKTNIRAWCRDGWINEKVDEAGSDISYGLGCIGLKTDSINSGRGNSNKQQFRIRPAFWVSLSK